MLKEAVPSTGDEEDVVLHRIDKYYDYLNLPTGMFSAWLEGLEALDVDIRCGGRKRASKLQKRVLTSAGQLKSLKVRICRAQKI